VIFSSAPDGEYSRYNFWLLIFHLCRYLLIAKTANYVLSIVNFSIFGLLTVHFFDILMRHGQLQRYFLGGVLKVNYPYFPVTAGECIGGGVT